MGTMLRLRQLLIRRGHMARQPIIFDFVRKQAYRSDESDLTAALRSRLTKRRVVKTVEGIPPQAVPQPKT